MLGSWYTVATSPIRIVVELITGAAGETALFFLLEKEEEEKAAGEKGGKRHEQGF